MRQRKTADLFSDDASYTNSQNEKASETQADELPKQETNSQDSEEENEDVPWLIDPSESPVEQIERQDRQESIKNCFEALPDVYRAVFMLIDIHEMDYQTVADTLKVPLGTVKSRLLRARLRMRDCLKSKGNFF